ncbi:MAG: valine--tRNA ligase [Candidatus Uhrbacteria bacterium]|nr:valine--tRNA ligase [Patescibacteria group bacterium]MBU1907261.1 valine--tRNA ligase [Patescibacteria group bacterium]
MEKPSLPKAYEPQGVEDDIYAAWESSGFFNPDNLPDAERRTETFSIVLPPPNVTGVLHIGHAAMLAIEDIMIRYARMQGKDTVWIPGTDHAAIATQTKVEKILMSEGYEDPRAELGREKFLERVRKFAQESHDTIVNQVRKMGSSIDWSREAFTLDEVRERAVRTVFKMMYEDGLIYQGHRIVNWCPHCHSTLADDEVEHKEAPTKIYTFRYSKDFPFAIATTRPETKLGDTAVAVHPEDERYQQYIGQTFEVDFVGVPLKLKIIADEAIDREYGTGALGVTPAHSHIDAEMAEKNNLETVQVINEDGKIMDAFADFAGQTGEEARALVVERLKQQGLLEAEEDETHNLSICYRCGSSIEPLPSKQWFIDVNKEFPFRASERAPIRGLRDGEKVTLKKLMQHVVRSNQIEIIPDRFDKTYFHWIDNLRDWCISRQIWYGHQIPVWYKGDEIYVGVEAPEGGEWVQDGDTLDTWFSSGLWTFSTLGWPEQTSDFKKYHPTSVMETGYDILFFWVARMILMTTYALGEIPFETVYLHGLIRDEQGRKMSKSLGNVIDPLDVIADYGTDAVRLSLVIGTTPGNDTKLSEEKIAGYRNFTNKLWNISRFVLTTVGNDARQGVISGNSLSRQPIRGGTPPCNQAGPAVVPKTLADKWMLSRFRQVRDKVTEHMDKYEYSQAGELLRDFTWNEFADWYLEIAKVQRKSDELKGSTDQILLYILERLLAMWHPFMPFVTEEIWKHLSGPLGPSDTGAPKGADKNFMMLHKWPVVGVARDEEVEIEFNQLQEVISAIRNLRAEYRIEPAKQVAIELVSEEFAEMLEREVETIQTLARVRPIEIKTSGNKPEGAAATIAGAVQIYLPLEGLVDVEKEKARLAKELASAERYLASLDKKLANKSFIDKAPEKLVSDIKEKHAEATDRVARIKTQLDTL